MKKKLELIAPISLQGKVYNILKALKLVFAFNHLFHEKSYLRKKTLIFYWKIFNRINKINNKYKNKGYQIHKITKEKTDNIKEIGDFFIGNLHDCVVRGNSSIMTRNSEAFLNPLNNIYNEVLAEEAFGYQLSIDKRKIFIPRNKIKYEFTRGVVFTDALSSNYAHWLTEVLTRINVYCSHTNEEKSAPLILNTGLPKSIYESVNTVAGNREIILIDDKSDLALKNCIFVSPTCYVPYSYRNWNKTKTDGIFNQYAMISLRNSILSKVKNNKEKFKIFIKRNSYYRKILNSAEIENFYKKNNYIILEPEKISFEDQVRLFNSADHIVGATGAGMANIMFSKLGCKISILISNSHHHALGYWRHIAECSGNQVNYIIGNSVDRESIHSDFTINIKNL